MKKINVWKLIWVLGIYIILGIILYLVIEYKVKWESLDTNNYLYFYNCYEKLCTSTTKIDNYYSRYTCDKDCPYLIDYNDDTAILNDNSKYLVYNYKLGNIIDNKYDSYEYLSFALDNYYLVSSNNKKGIIDKLGNVVVDTTYDNITLSGSMLKVSNNDLYGLLDNDFTTYLDVEYQGLSVNNDRVIIQKDNRYSLLLLNKEVVGSNYLYITPIDDDTYLVIEESNKIDIVNSNMESNLIMKIDGYMDYSNVDNIDTLNIHLDNGVLLFDVLTNTGTITYKYDIANNKLI